MPKGTIEMVSEDMKLPDNEILSVLSGLPEGIMAHDIIDQLHKELIRLGKPEKEVTEVIHKLMDALTKERDKAVEACYLAGYLKGMTDMSQRFKQLLDSRGEAESAGKGHRG